MKKFFEKDSVLKVFSFVIAIIVWLYILIVLDPSVNMVIKDVPIRYTQNNALTNQGLSIVDESKTTVEIKVNGSRKRLVNINSENIAATVDLSSITKAGTHSLPIMLSVPYDYVEVVGKKPDNIEITVDRLIEESRNIAVRTVGSPKNGYIAGTVELDPPTVLLSGAASVVAQISSVYVSVDITDRNSDIISNAKIEFVGSDGKVIEQSDEIFKFMSPRVTEVKLVCPIMKLKQVPIRPIYDGVISLKENILIQPNTITIYGYEEDIEEIEEVFTERISVDELRKNKNVNASLRMSEKIKARDNVNTVTVKIEKNS